MQFTTKLNINDTVWHIDRAAECIAELTITGINLTYNENSLDPAVYPIITYDTDAGHSITESGQGKIWWKTREEIIEHIVATVKARAKSKTDKKTGPGLPQDEFAKYFKVEDPKSKKCSGHGQCGCKSKPKTELENEFQKFFNADTDPTITPEERRKIIDDEFKKLFGISLQEFAADTKDTVKTAINKARINLNSVYDEVFGKH